MADLSASATARWPSVEAAWLQWRNRWRRWPRAAAALTGAFLALGLLGRIRAVEYLLALAALSPGFVVTLTAMLAGILVLRSGSRLTNYPQYDWLASLPRNLPIALRASAGSLAVLAIAAVLTVELSLTALWPAWIALRLIGGLAAGSALGVALAAVFMAINMRVGRGGRRQANAPARSHYASGSSARGDAPRRATLLPLGAWSVAEAHFRDRPTIRARSLILLLLAVPIGVSGGTVLAAAAAWLIVLHLINLTRALLRTAFNAARWLGPTAPGLVRFTWALSHRALAAQMLAAALLVIIAAVTHAPSDLRLAELFAVGWLAAVMVVAAVGCLLAPTAAVAYAAYPVRNSFRG